MATWPINHSAQVCARQLATYGSGSKDHGSFSNIVFAFGTQVIKYVMCHELNISMLYNLLIFVFYFFFQL